MRVRWLGRLLAGALLVITTSVPLACDTYGEETPPAPAADAATASADTNRPPEDASLVTSEASGPSPTEAGGPTTPCPTTCTGSCLGSGCSGGGVTANDCQIPHQGTKGDRFTLYVCPEGQTITLPAQCNNGGEVHVGVVRLGAGNWRFHVTGTMPLVATGDCGSITACRGGSSETTMDVTGPTVAMIGSFTPVSMCRELVVELD